MKNNMANKLFRGWIYRLFVGLTSIFVLFLGTSCSGGGSDAGNQNGKVMVYTTLFPLYDAAALIGGEHVTVTNMIPPGVESHDFEPKPKEMVDLQKADLFIYNGAGFERWIEKAVANLDQKRTKVINASEGITLLTKEDVTEGADPHGEESATTSETQTQGGVDPHIWLDADNMIKIAEKIYQSLKELDPANEGYYKKNYDSFVEQLKAVDGEYKEVLGKAKKKEFIVSHAAFGYLAHRYGLTQIPVSGITPDEVPSQTDMIRLIETAKEHQLQYIGFEAIAQSKVADTIRREANLKPVTLYTMDNVTPDQQKEGIHYLDLMRENLKTLKVMLEVEG